MFRNLFVVVFVALGCFLLLGERLSALDGKDEHPVAESQEFRFAVNPTVNGKKTGMISGRLSVVRLKSESANEEIGEVYALSFTEVLSHPADAQATPVESFEAQLTLGRTENISISATKINPGMRMLLLRILEVLVAPKLSETMVVGSIFEIPVSGAAFKCNKQVVNARDSDVYVTTRSGSLLPKDFALYEVMSVSRLNEVFVIYGVGLKEIQDPESKGALSVNRLEVRIERVPSLRVASTEPK